MHENVMLCAVHTKCTVQQYSTCLHMKIVHAEALKLLIIMRSPIAAAAWSSTRVYFRLANRNRILPLGYAVLVHAFVPRRSIELVTIVTVVMDDAPDVIVGVVLLDVSIHRWVGLGAVHGMVPSVCRGTGPSASLAFVLVIPVISGGYHR